jgi:hypothetical protein
MKESSSTRAKDCRYSTVPFQLTDKNQDVCDVREDSLLLKPLCVDANQSKVFVAKPSSSSLTSPVEYCLQDEPLKDDPLLSIMPHIEKGSAKQVPPLQEHKNNSDHDDFLLGMLVSTELVQSLTDLTVNKSMERIDDDMENSPIVIHLKRQSRGKDTNQHLSASLGSEIVLSTPARATTESVKAKRGTLKGAFRISSNKEHIDPGTDGSTSRSGGEIPLLIGPNPAVHHEVPVALCPAYDFSSSPNPLQASLQPPVSPFHRVSATGSPMHMLKVKSLPQSPAHSLNYPGESFFPPPAQAYGTDTLSSSARPTSRLRKNGIASMALRGVSKYHGSVYGTGNHGYASRPPSRVMYSGGRRTPDQPRPMSSPSRPSSGSVGFRHRILKRRTKATNRGEFTIAEDETAGARSKAASVLDGDEVMKLGEEIRTTMRVNIDEMPDGLEGDEEGPKKLNPNVTPFRKGLGPQIKRRSSYWDGDLKEVMNSPARKKVRGGCKGTEVMKEAFGDGDGDNEFVERCGSQFKETVRPRVSFNKDSTGKMERAGEVLKKTLIGCGERGWIGDEG